MVRLITDFEVTSPIQNIGLVWPFPSGTGIANLHYPTLRVGISTSIKNRFTVQGAGRTAKKLGKIQIHQQEGGGTDYKN